MINKERIINDYHHLLSQHLNEDYVSDTNNHNAFECIYIILNDKLDARKIANCNIYISTNRQRERQKMFKSGKKSQLALCIELLDTIHCYFMHSVDIGCRIIDKLENP